MLHEHLRIIIINTVAWMFYQYPIL